MRANSIPLHCLLGFTLSLTLYADYLPHLQRGSSISQAYEANSTLIHPAALAYQTELNGAQLLTGFSYGIDKSFENPYSIALALGYFGFALEKATSNFGNFQRYSFALGLPITQKLYLGNRFSFTKSDTEALSSLYRYDLGLQYRPTPRFALGILANGLNRPSQNGIQTPIELVAGATLSPLDRLNLSLDLSSSNGFDKYLQYEALLNYEILNGLSITAGYHKTHKFQGGLELRLANFSLFTKAQPKAQQAQYTMGFQASGKPWRSELNPPTVLEVEIDDSLEEKSRMSWLFGPSSPSLTELLLTLQKASKDKKVPAVWLKVENFPLGLAAAQEVHNELLHLRKAGKQVEVFLGNAGFKEYLIASAADRIHLEPQGELRLLGPSSRLYFIKGTLDKLGIEGEFLAKGKYKSAPEMFTRENSSEANREATLEILNGIRDLLKTLLEKRFSKGGATWEKVVQHGIFNAEDARDFKLVDEIASFENFKDEQNLWTRSEMDYQSNALALPPRVAIIVAEGDILQKKVRFLSFGGVSQVTPKMMKEQWETALGDPLVKAIVFRVSSPGGEVLASHQIASLVEKAKKRKPVVVSMGDVAASGGYLIAAPGETIFAEPLSQTGSIGVFLGKFNLSDLYKKIGLHKETLSVDPFADLYSENRAWTGERKEIMQRRLDQYYRSFLEYVSTQRQLPMKAVEQAAQGRVWLGTKASQLKLIDRQGGITDATLHAAKLAGLEAENFETLLIQESTGLLGLFGMESWVQQSMNFPFLEDELKRQLLWASQTTKNPILFLAPYTNVD